MNDVQLGRILRALRHRKGWRQADVSAAASVSRGIVSALEAGEVDTHTVAALRRAAQAVGGVVRITISVPGGDVGRLLDADHARLQTHWKLLLERHGWVVEAEVTFNIYGERGSVDLLAWHPATRTVLVVEIKSVIVDVGDLLGGVDRKTRLARGLARERGWDAAIVVPALVVLEGSTARRRLADHAPLFGRFDLRGRAAVGWVAEPARVGHTAPSGLLLLVKLPNARPRDRRRAGRQRVRIRPADSRSRRKTAGQGSVGEAV
jgi:transcriptional regulator with XRE-family HTH domain